MPSFKNFGKTMTQRNKELEEAAEGYAVTSGYPSTYDRNRLCEGFIDGADWQLKHDKEMMEKMATALAFYADKSNWNMAWRSDLRQYVPANTDGTSVAETKKWLEAANAFALYEQWKGENS